MFKDVEKLKKIFESYPEIKLVYVFGSTARGERGSMSDYDFALYLSEKNKDNIKIKVMNELIDTLKTDKIDVVVLNSLQGPEIKFNIIKEGKIIYEVEPYKVLVEPKILSEYFDFHDMLKRNNLTKV
jgi:uncharacterized protein